ILALVPDRTLVDHQAGHSTLEDYLERFRRRFRKAFFMALAPAYDGRDRQVFAVFRRDRFLADNCAPVPSAKRSSCR
ncbi:hypothetical protein ACC738_39255, partial [Rhizobium ruizarguesonis]